MDHQADVPWKQQDFDDTDFLLFGRSFHRSHNGSGIAMHPDIDAVMPKFLNILQSRSGLEDYFFIPEIFF